MTIHFKLLSVFTLLLCSGCATLDKGECQSADWEKIGFSDGAKGRLADARLTQHASACGKHNIVPDEQLYVFGHDKGVLDYCTPEQGLKLGRAGKEYNNVCPLENAQGFVAEYISGLSDELDDLAFDEDRAEDDLSEARADYRAALDTEAEEKVRKNRKKKVKEAEVRLSSIETNQREIRRWISEWSRKLGDMG